VRREGREAAVQLLYLLETSGRFQEIEEELVIYFDELNPEISPGAREFSERLCRGIVEHLVEVDSRIEGAALHWRTERMDRVDLSILRLAVYELLHAEDIPKAVVINEAIELAKEFGSDESSSFINGVLGRIARDIGSSVKAGEGE
jgi:transcription antitermination protein NusB